MGHISHLRSLQEKYASRGLNILTYHRQGATTEEILKVSHQYKINYAVATAGAGNYQGNGTIPQGWLIGVDGIVLWEGNPRAGSGQIDDFIEAEIAKIRYPGLGRLSVHEDVEKAAQQFARGNMNKARKAANKILEDDDAEEGATVDAQYVINHIQELGEALLAQATTAESERRYLDAFEIHTDIARRFKKEDEGDAAKQRIKEMKKDGDIKDEMKADAQWRMIANIAYTEDAADARAVLRAFIQRHEGTRAAADAQRALSGLGGG